MTSHRVSPRLVWAVERLDVQPDEQVLELGCGHGVALTLIAERLGPQGHVVGVDRSPAMTAAATARNAEGIAAGRTSVVNASLHDADLGGAAFDKVLAVHFPPFLGSDPAAELAVVRSQLAPGGVLHVVAHPRAGDATPSADVIARRLAANGFTSSVTADEVDGRVAFCVIATLS